MKPDQEKIRIVVTGTGVVTPIGIGTEQYWKNTVAGVNGLRDIQSFDTSDLRTHRGGEALDFVADDFLRKEDALKMGRASQMAVAAARMALTDADLDRETLSRRFSPERLAVSMGSTMGEPQILFDIGAALAGDAKGLYPIDWIFNLPSTRINNCIAAEFGFHGVNFEIPTACAAGNYAIGYAADLLRMRRADLCVAGGSDAFARMAMVGFNKLLAVAPEKVAPFDKNRAGMMVGEGAGCLVLERLEDALDRGATIFAEIVDYGLGCDAHKLTIPSPEGRGGTIAMRRALALSGLEPTDVDVVCAHGTGTRENDLTETRIIKESLGDHAYHVKVNSLKSMIGHTMGAASAIEAIACVKMVRENIIPPTINYQEPDPECDLDYVPNEAQRATVNVAVSNAYAFGGNCSSLVVRKYTSDNNAAEVA